MHFCNHIKIHTFFWIMLYGILAWNAALACDQATFSVDIYRTKQITVQQILDKYKNDLQSTADLLININHHPQLNDARYAALVNKITSGLKENGSFAFLNVSPIMYPGDNTLYITIDAVDMKDKKRLSHFIPRPTKNIPDPGDLIAQWRQYKETSDQIIYSKHRFPLIKHSTAWYSTGDFGEPALKKQIAYFQQQVPKYQSQLGRVLNLDKDHVKRAAAALLLGYSSDPHALIRTLTASMRDPNAEVRNNVNLVLSHVLSRVNVTHFPVVDTVQMLDFPLTTDRNKTLAVIHSLSNQPLYAKYYATHASKLLIASLKMHQPNLHKPAFSILKKISGKPYGEHDYQKWERWAETQKATHI